MRCGSCSSPGSFLATHSWLATAQKALAGRVMPSRLAASSTAVRAAASLAAQRASLSAASSRGGAALPFFLPAASERGGAAKSVSSSSAFLTASPVTAGRLAGHEPLGVAQVGGADLEPVRRPPAGPGPPGRW